MNRRANTRLSRFSYVLGLIALTVVSGLAITATAGAAGVRLGFVDEVRSFLWMTPVTTTPVFATKTSAQTGDWNVPSTWVGGIVPATGDSVVIAATHTVTLTANSSAPGSTGSVTVQSGGVLDLSANLLTAGTLTIDNGGEVQQGGSTNAPSGTITTRTYASNSTYTFKGTQAGTTGIHPTYGNLVFAASPSGAGTFVDLNVVGNLTINLGTTQEIRLATSTTGRTHSIGGNVNLQNGILVGSNGSSALGSSTTTIGGNLNITGGTFRGTNDVGSATFNIAGNISNAGTWQQDDGSSSGTFNIILNGSGSQTISGANSISFENLTINTTSTSALGRNIDVTGGLAVNGTLNCGTNFVSGAGAISFNAGSTLGIGSPDGIVNSILVGNLRNSGSRSFSGTANFVYNGAANQTTGLNLPGAVNNLTIENTGGAGNRTVTLSQATSVGGTLTLTSGLLGTTSTNLLTVTNTASGAVVGGSSTAYVNGPLARSLAADLISSGVYAFPVGKGGYNPFSLLTPSTSAGTGTTIRVEVFDASSGGSAGTNLSSINTDRYWSASITGGTSTLSTIRVSLTDASVATGKAIGNSTTLTGAYTGYNGNIFAPTIQQINNISTLGFFLIGTGLPDIEVQGNSVPIPNGDISPTAGDFTDFDNVAVGGTMTRTFTVRNVATGLLNLTGSPRVQISGSATFKVGLQPNSPVTGGSLSSVMILFTPTGTGPFNATVSIPSDDPDEPTYTYTIAGTGVSAVTRLVTTSGTDSGNCSVSPCATIAYAVGQAQNGDPISVGIGTYTQSNISINKPVRITGAGAGQTIIQAAATPGTATTRIFANSGTTRPQLELYDLTLQNGNINNAGGAVYSLGFVVVRNCAFLNNRATFGGGAISADVGTVTIENSTFSGNVATGFVGGGAIYSSSELIIRNSTFSGNSSPIAGGAINSSDPATVIQYSTIADNTSDSDNSGGEGGGGLIVGAGATVEGTIIAGNKTGTSTTAATADCQVNGAATFAYTLSGTGTGCTSGTGSATVTPGDVFTTVLGALASNGGTTQTHALIAGSPAIDQIPNGTIGCGSAPFNVDQRGSTRPLNSSCDKGAFESLPPAPTVAATIPFDTATNVALNSSIAVLFDQAMNGSTINSQGATGACTSSLQVSSNNFSTCIGIASVVSSGGGTIFTATPAAALSPSTTYKIRVTTAAQSAGGTPMAAAFTSATGFTTAPPSPPSISKSFGTSPVNIGGTSLLTIVVTNPNPGTALTGVAFTDALPTGLTVPNIGSFSQCAGTANISSNTITLSGATIPAGLTCTIATSVTASGAATGVLTNTTSTVTSTNAGTGNSATANITVNAPAPTLGTYTNSSVALGGNTTITPGAAPTDATSINVSAPSSFIGGLTADPVTGVIRITNAALANISPGTYPVTVRAFGPGGEASTTFDLTVTNGTICSGAANFTGSTNVAVASNPISVAVGDFNGDGNQDVAATNYATANVSIRLGDGLGGFSGTTNIAAGIDPLYGIEVGDFNNDGRQDIAASTAAFAGNVRILQGDGAGGFTFIGSVSVGSFPDSIALGDFNGDGKQDLATANAGAGGSVSIRLGDGAGGFTGTTTVAVGSTPRGIAVGDFNADGKQDIATANNGVGANSVSIRLGDGLGGFSGSTTVSVDVGPQTIAVGDFNGDGKQDFATANSSSDTVSIRLGDGTGLFTGTTTIAVGDEPRSVAVGDFNNDGNQDFAAANRLSNTVSTRFGDGLGGFTGTTDVAVGTQPYFVALGDFNNDGKQDIAAANFSGTVSIRLGECIPAPTVASVAPTSGSVLGGNAVSIFGTGFTGVTGVTFGGAACTSVNFVSDTEITCTAPVHAAGAVSVLVTTPGGTNAANTLYTYINNCAAGTYFNGSACVAASAGFYVPTSGQTSQTPCAAGTFQPDPGSVSCNQATAGNYVPAPQATAQIACAVGTYQPGAGAQACLQADAGSFVAIEGSASQSACLAGTYQPNPGQSSCLNADAGSFVAGSGSTSQTACAAGSFQPNPGASSCILADAGTFITGTGSTTAGTPCAIGSYQPNTGQSSCIAASVGNFVNNPGSSSQSQCAAGTYQPNTGQSSCMNADAGSFVANPGSASQTPCAAGSFQPNPGATSCNLAAAGTFISGTGSTVAGTPCSPGTYQPLTGQAACTPASAGNFVQDPGATAQIQCSPGRYQPLPGQTSCTLADPGFFVANSGATAQDPCPPGTTSGAGATICTAIPETHAEVVAFSLAVTDINGGTSNDNLNVSCNTGNLIINDPGNPISAGAGVTVIDANTVSVPIGSIMGQVVFDTLAGNDALTVNLNGCVVLPSGGIQFAGGAGTSDSLVLQGTTTTVDHGFFAADAGTVFTLPGIIGYNGVEGLTDSIVAQTRTFNLPAGPSGITLGDDGTSGNGLSRLSGSTIPTVTFANPTTELTINRGNAADQLAVTGVPDLTCTQTFGSETDPLNVVNITGSMVVTGSLNFAATTVTTSVTSSISTTGGLYVVTPGTLSVMSGVIAGGGAFTVDGGGTVVVAGTNTFTGGVVILGGSVVSVSSDVNLGAGPLVYVPGYVQIVESTLLVTSSFTIDPERGIFVGGTSGLSYGTVSVMPGVVFVVGSIVDDNGTSTSGVFVTGGGTFVVTAVNLYSGSTVIVDSTVQVSSDVNLGSAPVVFTAGHLIIDGGTLYATSTFTVDANRGILIGDSVVVGTGSFWVDSSVVLTVASVIDDNGTGDDGLVKVGPGTLKLDGANAYEGTTDVDQGTLNVVGSTTSDMEANSGSTIAGTGDVNGTLTTSSANVLPGTSPGILSTDSVTFDNGSTFGVEIGGATPGNGATNHDQLNVTGTVALGGATLSLGQFNGFVPTNGQTFVIINNDSNDAVTGTFNGLVQGGTISNFLGSGLTAIISYAGGTGNDVVLTAFAPPTVTSVNPTSGPTAGGNSVTITGTNFTGASGVAFGGAACPITSNNGTEIVCTAPAHAAGAVSVEVTTPGGTNAANTLYTYEAETTVTVSGGNLLIEDTNGGNSDDNITIACTPPNITITDSGTGLSQTILASSVTGSITVNTFGGNDTLTVNLSGCGFIPAGGLFFNGGTAGDDALNISGYSGGTTTYNYLNANDGDIVMAGGTRTGTITYTGLEPIVNSGTAADVIFNLPAAPNTDVALTDDGISGNGMSRLSGTTFEMTDFANATNSVSINSGSSLDEISVGNMVDFASSLNLGSDSSRFARIWFTSNLSLGADRNVIAFGSGQIRLLPSSLIATSGGGEISLTTDRDIVLLTGARIIVGSGNLNLNANQQMIPTGGEFQGVLVDGATVEANGTGDVFVNGRGGSTGTVNHGVHVRNAGLVRGGTTSGGTGSLAVSGTGGSSGSSAYGVYIEANGQLTAGGPGAPVTVTGQGGNPSGGGATNIGVVVLTPNGITSGGGPVAVTGTGGSGTGGDHHGVRVFGGTITALGAGTVTIIGSGGGSAAAGGCYGVDVRGPSGTITSSGGAVNVTGQGGTCAQNVGVVVTNATITSGTNGPITVTGTGGNTAGTNNDGVNMNAGSIAAAGTGTVTIDGTATFGASSEGIDLSGGSPSISTSLNSAITLIGDSMNLGSGSINAGTGLVTLRQKTNSVGIDLGSAADPAAGPLSLTDAEVDRITAGTLNIGNANSGTIIFNSSISLIDAPIIPNLNLTTGGQIQDSFSGTEITVSNLGMTAGTGGIGQSISGAVDFQADTVWTNTSGTNSNQFMFTSGQVDIVTPGLNAGSGSITVVGGRWDTTATGGVLSDVVVYGNGANVATLGGIGSVLASESTTADGGIISPGTSPGILNTGNVSFGTSSIFEVEIGGTSPGNAITNHDQLNVTGTVDLAGAALTLAQFNGFTPTAGQQFVIINNDGGEAILNPFGGVAEGATIAPFLIPGMQATISYVGGTGNDVVLTAVLPPAIITLSDPNPIGFGNVTVGNTSPAQTYNVSGVNLTADIVVTAPTHFQVSLSPTTGFGTSVSIPFGSGTVTNVPVYIRFVPTAPGVFSDPITHTSGAAPQQNKTALGTGIAAVCVAPPSGLTAKYRAENNFLDETGGFNAAGTGSPTFAAGRIGQAFDLNGTTQYVIANPATAMETNSRFSFDAWVNRRNHLNISQHQGLLIKDIGNGSDSFGVFIFNNGTPGNNADDGFYGQYNGGPTFQTANGTVPAANQWFHIAQTYDGITLRLYLNGVQIHSVGLASRTVGTGPLGIGARSNGQHAFNGLIDEVEVYDRTLSATEVAARFNSGPTSGMVAWFKGETNTLDQFGVNNASSTGTPFGYTGGKVGQAFNFGGGTGRVFVNDPGSSPFDLTTGLTIDAWIRPTVAANIGIASKYISSGPATDPFRSYQFYMESTQTVRFRTNRCADVISASTIPLNAWSHVAATFDSTGQCRIYVNGVLDGTPQTASGPLLTNDVAFLIGSTESGTLGNFSGQIDEVQVFSRSLGGSEIAAIYNASTTGKCLAPEIVVEEPVGTDATDNVTVSSFGSTIVGQSGTTKTYTIRNRGTTTLNVNVAGITIDGANAGDFVLNTGSMSPTLAPNGNAFITVQFVPTAGGVRNAALHIPSDDADENPFDIALTGTGLLPGTLQFSSANYTVSEGVASATITVTRTGGTDGIVGASYATVAGGSATGGAACTTGVDYINTSGLVSFGNGSAASQTFSITICPDAALEPDESINLSLTTPTGGATIGSPNASVLIVTNDDCLVAPSTVYVDDNWVGTTPGTDPDGGGPATNFGCNAFATIQGGINGVAVGGTVNVGQGNYPENVIANKSLSLIGNGQDLPTATLINPAGGGGVTVSANSVTLTGLRINTQGAGAGIEFGVASLTNLTINSVTATNALSGLRVNDGVNLNGLTVTNSHFDGNVLQGWYLSEPDPGLGGMVTNVQVTNTTFNDNPSKGIYAEKLDNATFDGITINNSGTVGTNHVAGIDLNLKWAAYSNIQILNSTITNNGKGDPNGGGILIKARSSGSYAGTPATLNGVTLRGLVVRGNGTPGTGLYAAGIRIGESNNSLTGTDAGPTGVDISNSVIVGNATHGVRNATAAPNNVVAENNWWGCNAGPGNTGCDSVTGIVDFDPWIVLGVSASPNPITPGSNSTVTANMTQNSAGGTPVGTIPSVPVAFTATQGTIAPPTGTITSGLAASTFTSTSATTGTGCATVDNQLVCTNVNVTAPNFTIDDVTLAEGNAGTTSFTFTITRNGGSALSSSVTYATANGTAVAPGDLTAISATVLNFAPSAGNATQTVTVLVNGDTQFELNEDFTVQLTAPVNATISDASGLGTINNDDPCVVNPIVQNNLDDGVGSLRRAVFEACTGSTITFAPAVTPTITLTSGQITIDKSLTITGPGASLLAVSGNDQSRVFAVNTGATVNISRLTVTGGKVLATYGTPVSGAGITNSGNLTLSEMSVSGNRIVPDLDGYSDEEDGGGIYNSGTLTVSKSSINNNVLANSTTSGQATLARGAGLTNAAGGVANISESSFSGNTITGFSFSNNGGAISNEGSLSIVNSLIAGNSLAASGSGSGGGISAVNAIIVNTTISGNSVAQGVGGGGIEASNGVNLINCTITGNSGNGGAGIRIDGTVNARNTIVSGNTGSNLGGVVGTFAINDHNIVGDEANINLGPLANNGGPTQTHALLAGSSAIDAGNNCVFDNTCTPAVGSAVTTDQRGAGFSRRNDGNGDLNAVVDIGAYERPSCSLNIQVVNTADNGAGSLRQAVIDVCPGGTITFAPAVTPTITLTSGQITIDKNLTISGPGANVLTVSGSNLSRIFDIPQSTPGSGYTVSISGLTFTNGNAFGGPGGAIRTLDASLSVSRCSFTGNTALTSAAIDQVFGVLFVSDSTLSGNTATAGGATAAIQVTNASASVVNSTLSGNVGTAIYNVDSFVSVLGSTLTGNSRGFISTGVATVNNTIIANSTVAGGDCALANGNNNLIEDPGPNIVCNSFSNSVYGVDPNLGPLMDNGGTTLTHALLPGSQAINAGADLSSLSGPIDNSTTTITLAPLGPGVPALSPGLLIQIDTEQMLVTAVGGVDFNVLTVTRGANGTTAAAHANGAAVNTAFDQRGVGFARRIGAGIDIGAFEVPNLPPVYTAPANQSGNEGGSTAFDLGSFTDGTFGPWTVVVDWGDGSPTTTINRTVDGAIGTSNHAFPDNGVFTVTITVTDSGALSDTGTFTVTVVNVPPTATFANGGPYVFGQPGTVSFSGQSDPSPVDTTAGFRYSYDFDNNGSFEIGDGTYAGGVTNASAALPALPVGTRTVRGRIVDKDGGLNDYTTVVTVNKANTTTTLASSANPSVFGQSVTFTATISVVSPGAGTPTGTVTFRDNGVNIGTCAAQAVSGNAATCSISTLAIGTHPITAVYNGDGNFIGSTSNTISQVVDKGNTTTTVTAAPVSPSVFGQSVTFTATVAVVAPGAGTPTGTVSFNIDGNIYCANTPLTVGLTATCTQAGLPALPAGLRDVVAIYSGNANFNGSTGDLNYTVNKANTATTITSDSPDPSLVNQPYTVAWTVVPNPVQVNSGTPTGTVTVNGGVGGGSCTAPVTAGGCQLTPTTTGVKTISATYNGDNNFNPSTSATTTHTVNVAISGTVRQAPGMTPIAGLTMTMSGCASATATTNASGVYTIVFGGPLGGVCTITPPAGLFDPVNRTFPVNDNITGADFTRYASAADIPRTLSLNTQFVVPGATGSMPVVLDSQGNEASVSFTVQYPFNTMATAPTFVCGPQAPGCTITTDTSTLGRVGVTIVPAGGVFSMIEAPEGEEPSAQKQIATMNFTIVATGLPNAAITFVNSPVDLVTRDAASNPLLTRYIDGLIVFAQGLEGDVANRNTGNGAFEAADVVQVRRFVAGLDTPVGTHNEFQRADSAPASVGGDGFLSATDVVQTRRYVAGLDPSRPSAGPGVANSGPIAPPEALREAGSREIRIGSSNASTGSRVSVPVEMVANGDEMAVSFIVRYDATRLGNASVELANAPAGAILTANADEPGVIRILVDAATTFAGSREFANLVKISFDVSDKASTGDTRILIEGSSVSDARATSLGSKATNGVISIAGPNALSVEISGRVLIPGGAGLRNATVTLTDASGVTRSATTGTFGYYRIDGIAPGQNYTLAVTSRRYRFAQTRITPAESLTNVDLTAQE